MSVYQKNIIYLYVYQDDTKLHNAGFVKMEQMDERYGLYARIKNAGEDRNGEYDVYMKEESEARRFCVGRMTLQSGSGDFKVVWNARQVEDIEKLWASFEVIEIMLGENRKLLGVNKHIAMKAAAEGGSESTAMERGKESAPSGGENGRIRTEREGTSGETREGQTENGATDRAQVRETEKQSLKGSTIAVAEAPEPESKPEPEETAPAPAMEEYETDKWKELLRTYPNVHPFGDDRCYITLEPKDFPVLTSEYQHLSGNSFLLHGFYNYRHIILGKEDDYLLGVPGTYHEREKMVALMFGFEGFESENKNPCTGTFGYYMRRVKI